MISETLPTLEQYQDKVKEAHKIAHQAAIEKYKLLNPEYNMHIKDPVHVENAKMFLSYISSGNYIAALSYWDMTEVVKSPEFNPPSDKLLPLGKVAWAMDRRTGEYHAISLHPEQFRNLKRLHMLPTDVDPTWVVE